MQGGQVVPKSTCAGGEGLLVVGVAGEEDGQSMPNTRVAALLMVCMEVGDSAGRTSTAALPCLFSCTLSAVPGGSAPACCSLQCKTQTLQHAVA